MSTVAGRRRGTEGTEEDGTWRAQVDALVQAVSGGMLFGIPMLYTLEVWRVGATSQPPRLLGILVITAVPVFLLNRTSGFRRHRDTTARQAARDTVIGLAVSLLTTAVVLTLLREITLSTPWSEALGKTVYAAVAFALGVSLGHHLLTGSRQEGDNDEDDQDDENDENGDEDPNGNGRHGDAGDEDDDNPRLDPTVADVAAAAMGALFIAANIAPTEEVSLLAQAMSPPWLITMVGFSLLVTYAIVFRADFTDSAGRHAAEGLLQHPLVETLLSYCIALLVALVLLVFFRNVDATTPLGTVIAEVVVLGLPAAIGGAAGRLAV